MNVALVTLCLGLQCLGLASAGSKQNPNAVNCGAKNGWLCGDHGKQPVYSSMLVTDQSPSGSATLWGIGNGRLWQRHWGGSSWAWQDHGKPQPSGLGATDTGPPACKLDDGKWFSISNGRLVEAYRNGAGQWIWHIHGKPASGESIWYNSCWATKRSDGDSVFVVTASGKLYERYWHIGSSAWAWAYHSTSSLKPRKPSGINRGGVIEVYAVATNGNLWRRSMNLGSPHGTGTWQSLGRPSGKYLNTVQCPEFASSRGIFLTATNSEVCEYISTVTTGFFRCYGAPPGTPANKGSRISMPFETSNSPVSVHNCNKLPVGWHVFARGWNSGTNSPGNLYHLHVGASYNPTWKHMESIPNGQYYIDDPTVMNSWGCPKVFFTQSNGHVLEKYLS